MKVPGHLQVKVWQALNGVDQLHGLGGQHGQALAVEGDQQLRHCKYGKTLFSFVSFRVRILRLCFA